jgi:hypothetical protein
LDDLSTNRSESSRAITFDMGKSVTRASVLAGSEEEVDKNSCEVDLDRADIVLISQLPAIYIGL